MEIHGKVHCMFEQSGTFKNEFKKLGIDAYDYDIQNNFGRQTFRLTSSQRLIMRIITNHLCLIRLGGPNYELDTEKVKQQIESK